MSILLLNVKCQSRNSRESYSKKEITADRSIAEVKESFGGDCYTIRLSYKLFKCVMWLAYRNCSHEGFNNKVVD